MVASVLFQAKRILGHFDRLQKWMIASYKSLAALWVGRKCWAAGSESGGPFAACPGQPSIHCASPTNYYSHQTTHMIAKELAAASME